MTTQAGRLIYGILMTLIAFAANPRVIEWRSLPDLPVALGGQFVGVIDNHLVVAGGSYWPTSQWEGGTKAWVDTVYVLGRDRKQWRLAGRLPEALGYGVSVSTSDSMLCLGGQTQSEVSARVYRLTFSNGAIAAKRLADLPHPMMMMGGTTTGGSVYLAGGQSTMVPTQALDTFWTLPLQEIDRAQPRWTKLPTWPGPRAFSPQLTGNEEALYLVGGADLVPVPGQPASRRTLRNAYEFRPGAGWRTLPDYPHPVQAGLAAMNGPEPLIFGGSDGILGEFESVVKDDHPGFQTMVWTLRSSEQRWVPFSRMPAALVTTGLVRWGMDLVIAGGEDRPGHRSARVMAGRLAESLSDRLP